MRSVSLFLTSGVLISAFLSASRPQPLFHSRVLGCYSQNAPPPSITLLQTLGGPNFSRADADTRGALESYAELGEGEIGALVGMAGDKVCLSRLFYSVMMLMELYRYGWHAGRSMSSIWTPL